MIAQQSAYNVSRLRHYSTVQQYKSQIESSILRSLATSGGRPCVCDCDWDDSSPYLLFKNNKAPYRLRPQAALYCSYHATIT